MGNPSYFRQPQIVRIPSLLRQVRSGEIRVARFQRRFVWGDDQRIDLIDSVYKGMPIGSFLTWRTQTHKLPCYDKVGPFEVSTSSGSSVNQYLLDGHQRLTTLYATLGAGIGKQTSELNLNDGTRWRIFFDLKEQDLRLGFRGPEPPVHWLDLSIIFDTRKFLSYQRKLSNDSDSEALLSRSEEVVELFKDYQIPMVPMVTEDLEQVTVSFQRINTKGTTMSEVQMVNALSYDSDSDFELNDRLEELQQEMGSFGWEEFEDRLILHVLKAILGLDIYRAEASEISEKISEEPDILKEVLNAIRHAAEFMAEQLQVLGPKTIPYSPQPVLIADAIHNNDGGIDDEAKSEVERWFWATTYSEIFAGANSSKIRRAQNHLRSVVNGETSSLLPDISKQVLPVERFDYRWARGRALVLELAELGPKDSSGSEIDSYRQLADHGNNATLMLFQSREIGKENNKGPENRFIVKPKDTKKFRNCIVNKDNPLSDEWLASHAIPRQALDYLRSTGNDLTERERKLKFLEVRRERVLELEKERVQEIGLDYIAQSE